MNFYSNFSCYTVIFVLQLFQVPVKVCVDLLVTITEGAPRQISDVREEVHYSARLGVYTDGTWLQLMCCTYSDIPSLYFRGRDELRFGREKGERGIGM